MPLKPLETQLVVVGAGPGGYAAAFYAADLGKKVILVDEGHRLGGVCLNAGCIPSKAYLHIAKLIAEAREAKRWGVVFKEPEIDVRKLRAWKESVLDRLGKGIVELARGRGVSVMKGRAYFEDSRTIRVETSGGQKFLRFENAIIAVGSKAAIPKAFDLGNPRIMTSTEALEIEEIPDELLVVGGGYIGMELGTVYATLGSQVVLVEALPVILAGADSDLVRPVMRYAEKHFREMRLNTKVIQMATRRKKIEVIFEGEKGKGKGFYDRVLVSVGRVPNCADLGLEHTQVARDEKGFIRVDERKRTQDPAIFAIGDVAGGDLLAHKASKEARIAVEAIAGKEITSLKAVIPAVIFTDPEIAWCGLTEGEAREKKIKVEIARFPWAASGRAVSVERTDGLTKLILEPGTERVLGMGIVGTNAGELISEGALAIEMGATARDLAETVHPHPTLSETLMETAESFYGHSTHTASSKRK